MKSLVIVFALVLAGCATQPGAVVKEAVATACEVPVPETPVFPADQLTGDEDIFTLAKVLWADLKVRTAYEIKLEALKGCTATHH